MRLAELLLPLQQRTLALLARRAPASALPPHLLTGLRGERAAYFHLRRLGYTIVAERFTAAPLRGDLDLVAWDGATLVIVEVKTRTARDFASAASAIDREKQTQLRRMTNAYLKQLPREHRDRVAVRFDVVSVYLVGSAAPVFEVMRDAFPLRRAFVHWNHTAR